MDRGIPACQLLACGLGDEVADRPDEAGLLRKGDEAAGGHDLAVGPAPAHQRFGSHEVTIAQVDQRLVVDEELFCGDAPPEVLFRQEPVLEGIPHRRVERLAPPLAELLRPVHGDIGVPEELLGLRCGVPRGHDAHACADPDLGLGEGEVDAERALHPLRHDEGVAFVVHVLAEDHELVAPEACNEVRRSHGTLDPAGGRHQEFVTGIVAEAVVDPFEAVEVHDEDRQGAVLACEACNCRPQAVHEQRPVCQPGQRVVERLLAKCHLGSLALDGVADRSPQRRPVHLALDQIVLSALVQRGHGHPVVLQSAQHDDGNLG